MSPSNPRSVILTFAVTGDLLKPSSPGALILSEEAILMIDTFCSGRCLLSLATRSAFAEEDGSRRAGQLGPSPPARLCAI